MTDLRNRRVFYRLPVEFDVRIRTVTRASRGSWAQGRVVNLSSGGMLLKAHMLRDMDDAACFEGAQRLEIELTLPGEAELMLLPAKIVWFEDVEEYSTKRRAGIQFAHIEDELRVKIEHFVKTRLTSA